MSKKNEYIVGLDIGTTKICCIIGEISHENQVDIIGLGQYPSRGLRKGVVAVSYTHLTLPTKRIV